MTHIKEHTYPVSHSFVSWGPFQFVSIGSSDVFIPSPNPKPWSLNYRGLAGKLKPPYSPVKFLDHSNFVYYKSPILISYSGSYAKPCQEKLERFPCSRVLGACEFHGPIVVSGSRRVSRQRKKGSELNTLADGAFRMPYRNFKPKTLNLCGGLGGKRCFKETYVGQLGLV